MSADPVAPLPPALRRLRSRWGLAVIPVAFAAVITGAVFGITGLLANPIVSVSASGLTTISGSFQPVTCPPGSREGCAQGYVQAGARSVFVVFPTGCSAPAFGTQVTLTARRDPSEGSQAYLATGCAGR